MSRRVIEKHILMTRAEAEDLKKKAKRTCLSEGALMRTLLKGYEPRERPDERFYDAMGELSKIGKEIDILSERVKRSGSVDSKKLKEEITRWHKFQADIERTFLRPGKNEGLKWQ